MLLIASPLALLVIYAGMKLLAQTKKEALGNLHKYVSWFLVIMGFLLLFGISCACIVRCCHQGERMMEQKCKMMEERNFNGGCQMGGQMPCMMMYGHGRMMEGCCGGMMNRRHHGGEMEGCCNEREECGENMECERHHGKRDCDEESKECETKKGECKKDTIKVKKK
jgi:hypothetical protein